MKTTIDKAGRVVIPALVRERAGLVAGTELEVTLEDSRIRLERVAPGPRLVKVGRRLVARPTARSEARPPVDIFLDTSVIVMLRAAAQDGTVGGRIYDAHIAEIARAAGAAVVVTDNRRHFMASLCHGIRVETPAEFLASVKNRRS